MEIITPTLAGGLRWSVFIALSTTRREVRRGFLPLPPFKSEFEVRRRAVRSVYVKEVTSLTNAFRDRDNTSRNARPLLTSIVSSMVLTLLMTLIVV